MHINFITNVTITTKENDMCTFVMRAKEITRSHKRALSVTFITDQPCIYGVYRD